MELLVLRVELVLELLVLRHVLLLRVLLFLVLLRVLLGVLLVLRLLVLRLLRILLLAACVGHLTLLGRLSGPTLVPVERVLRVPGFGGAAPAILSHRSPRAARRRQRRLCRGTRFRL
ncbi:hypothetical protein Slala03_38420 [Streptomyces lavendulae subsp. lavendulae]|nr:hypothetical protein Slala03_38420 [Streptomyces lavendulae subsp. lavendulae]GLX38638.1 hypothetical protein Sros01_47110 [Streptomyces roseochromogenus]